MSINDNVPFNWGGFTVFIKSIEISVILEIKCDKVKEEFRIIYTHDHIIIVIIDHSLLLKIYTLSEQAYCFNMFS